MAGQVAKKLDFMILGAQKAGTSALAAFLSEHPDICMSSPKEAHAFDNLQRLGLGEHNLDDYYEAFFRHCPGRPCRGEATPIYLFLPDAAAHIARYNPELKLIVLLRDPVERALSHYRMSLAEGTETLPFWAALLAEPFRLRRDRDPLAQTAAFRTNSYRSRGLYSKQLSRYLEHFPREQLLVVKTESLRFEHDTTLRRIEDFLGVTCTVLPPSREVFSQPPLAPGAFPITRALLGWSYRREMARLRSLLGCPHGVSPW